VEHVTLGGVAAFVQLAIGAVTLLYMVFGLGARLAVTEFKVDQLWRLVWRGDLGTERSADADRGRR
jgi:hypothetical protein